jgi:hypothetical protein
LLAESVEKVAKPLKQPFVFHETLINIVGFSFAHSYNTFGGNEAYYWKQWILPLAQPTCHIAHSLVQLKTIWSDI